MSSVMTLGLALALGVAQNGSGADSAEGILKDMLATMKEMTATLESIKDDASAEAAIPKLEKLSFRMKELMDKGKALKLSPQEEKKLQDKFKAQTEEAMKKLIKASASAGFNAPARAQKIAAAIQKGMGGKPVKK